MFPEVIDFSPNPDSPNKNPQTPRLKQSRTLFFALPQVKTRKQESALTKSRLVSGEVLPCVTDF